MSRFSTVLAIRVLLILAATILSAGCHENYFVRADLYDRVMSLPPPELQNAVIAADRGGDAKPVYLRLASIESTERVSEGRLQARTGNGLKTAAVTFGVITAAHALIGVIAFATPPGCSGGELCGLANAVVGIGFLGAAAVLLVPTLALAIAGVARRPGEFPVKPHYDAAAGVLRF